MSEAEAGQPKTYAEICSDKDYLGTRNKELRDENARLAERARRLEGDVLNRDEALREGREHLERLTAERDRAVADCVDYRMALRAFIHFADKGELDIATVEALLTADHPGDALLERVTKAESDLQKANDDFDFYCRQVAAERKAWDETAAENDRLTERVERLDAVVKAAKKIRMHWHYDLNDALTALDAAEPEKP